MSLNLVYFSSNKTALITQVSDIEETSAYINNEWLERR